MIHVSKLWDHFWRTFSKTASGSSTEEFRELHLIADGVAEVEADGYRLTFGGIWPN